MAPLEEGGGIDIFSPLTASGQQTLLLSRVFSGSFCVCLTTRLSLSLSASGVTLVQTLSALTGLEVQAPMGLATGSFQSGE